MRFEVYEQDMPAFVHREILPLLSLYRIFALYGPLGAGKTSLVRQVLAIADIRQPVTSPTFGYVNTYKDSQGHIYHHFDLYRLAGEDVFFEYGFQEYLYNPDAYVFIEWPECIKPLLTSYVLAPVVCFITLSYDLQNLDRRVIEIHLPAALMPKK